MASDETHTWVTMRLTVEDKKRIKRAAEASGRSLSGFVRHAALDRTKAFEKRTGLEAEYADEG